jgi:hypothetical protein
MDAGQEGPGHASPIRVGGGRDGLADQVKVIRATLGHRDMYCADRRHVELSFGLRHLSGEACQRVRQGVTPGSEICASHVNLL